MLSLTHQALEKFDNSHDFERMCSDILNSQGFLNVTPIAPQGGSDSGKDITFTTSGGGKGLACVSLRKDVDKKFKEDFYRRAKNEYEQYIFFTNLVVSASKKLEYEKYCVNNLAAILIIYDIESLRSLLDSSLKNIRKQYLHIDDNASAQIKNKIARILQYPSTLNPKAYSDRAGYAEFHLTTPAMREIYYYLLEIDDDDITQIPGSGKTFLDYKRQYYNYCEQLQSLTDKCRTIIFQQSLPGIQFQKGWLGIFFNYFLMRRFGRSKEEAQSTIHLNYDITKDSCEKMFIILSQNSEVVNACKEIDNQSSELQHLLDSLN